MQPALMKNHAMHYLRGPLLAAQPGGRPFARIALLRTQLRGELREPVAPGGLPWDEALRRRSEDLARRNGIDLVDAAAWLRARPRMAGRPYVFEIDPEPRHTARGTLDLTPGTPIVIAARVWDPRSPEGWSVALAETSIACGGYQHPDDLGFCTETTQGGLLSWGSMSRWIAGLLRGAGRGNLLARAVLLRIFAILPEDEWRFQQSASPFTLLDVEQADATFARRGVQGYGDGPPHPGSALAQPERSFKKLAGGALCGAGE